MNLKKFPKFLHTISLSFYNSIAFYPLLISIAFFFLAIIVVYIQQTKYIEEFSSSNSYLLVRGYENGRAILSLIIAGVISLTVFSFSMVMIVLNQASSSYSPRVIPGVVTKNSHQVVLGFYLGTIIYSLIVYHNITPEDGGGSLPQFGIFLSEVFGILSLSFFVYFIHSISESIQIDTIISQVKDDTLSELKSKKKIQQNADKEIDTEDWETIPADESGYYRSFKLKSTLKFAAKHDLIIKILSSKGSFLLKNFDLLKVNKRLKEKDQAELLGYFIFHEKEFLTDNYLQGFNQLSEVAVKALSPGINDPGTAIKVINQLSLLLKERLSKTETQLYYDKNDKVRVIEKILSFDSILHKYLGPIRNYGKRDPAVMTALLISLLNLLKCEECSTENSELIFEEIAAIIEDADSAILNSRDRKKINEIIKNINSLFSKNLKTLK
jgi:uncharacterized membrane protein